MVKKKKKILLVIGGGISAYKSLDLIRLLKKNRFEVRTILTKSGSQFVTPMSLVSLSGNKVYENLFDKEKEAEIDHISLSRWADLILVVPATANFMSKLSYGKADDLASTVMLASNKDIFLVPAMNVKMWENKATQDNFKTLIGYGYRFIGPIKGEMACGEYGKGKMSKPNNILKEVKNYFLNKNIFKKKKYKALVTAGPTREYFDPVRFISNESSGKQGYEIAVALSRQGIKTTLIMGPSNLQAIKGVKTVKIKSSAEMFKEVKKALPVDIAVCAPAVSDYKPILKNENKIKKTNSALTLEMKKTDDILEYLGKNNISRPKLVVGFSAETEDLIYNSKIKIKNKNSDLIIANDVSNKKIGFDSDFNEVTLIEPDGKTNFIKRSKKSFIASAIVEKIVNKLLFYDKNLN